MGVVSYLYLGTSDSSSLPATVGNSYTRATGNQRTSETSVVRPSSPPAAPAALPLPLLVSHADHSSRCSVPI
jgi:hypothetical protein